MNCSSYKKKKALNVSKGVGEEHPLLKWSEHAGCGALADPKYPLSRRDGREQRIALSRAESRRSVVVLMTPDVVASIE